MNIVKIQYKPWIDCHSKMSHLLRAGGREARKPSLCILEGDVLRGVTVRWRKMTLHLWWQWERGRADSYPNSFPCRSAAQNQSRRQWMWCTGRTVTPANRAPRKEAVKERDTLHLNDVWLPLRVKCSLHASMQFHLSLITEDTCLHWFRYHCGSSCWAKVPVYLWFE